MEKHKVFFGWYVSGFAALSLFFGFGIRGAFGVFFPSMLQDLGWSRTLLSSVISLSLLVNAVLSPTVGNLVGRFGGRWLITAGSLLLGTGVILVGQSTEVWHLFVAYGLIVAVGINCMGMVVNQSMVVGWFIKKRAFALSVTTAGITLGIAVLTPLSNFLISRYGWRMSNVLIGIAVIAIILPLAQFFAKRRPEDMGLLPDGEDPETAKAAKRALSAEMAEVARNEPEITYTEGIRSRNFWLLMMANLMMGVPGFISMTHVFAYAVERGVSEFHAANVLSLGAILGLISGFFFGFVSDKINSRKIPLLVMFFIIAIAYFILIYIRSTTLFYIQAIVAGLGMGGGIVFPALVGDQFGRMGMGKFYGIITLSGAVGAAIGPVLGGWIYDVAQSYVWAWIVCILLQGTGAICILLMGKSPLEQKSGVFAPAGDLTIDEVQKPVAVIQAVD